MAKKAQKKTNKRVPSKPSEPRVKDFLDLIAPTAVKFNTDHYICGGTYRCTLALRSYPASTEELALLRHLGEKSGVTLSIYNRKVSVAEEDKIIHNAENKNKLDRGSTSSMKQAVTAEANLQDVAALIASMRKNSEPLIHCAVFIELSARDPDSLRALRDEVTSELIRSKLGADRLLLRQRLQNKHFAPGKQRGIDFKRGVFRRRADQRDDFALFHIEGDAGQRVDAAVAHLKVGYFQEAHSSSTPR